MTTLRHPYSCKIGPAIIGSPFRSASFDLVVLQKRLHRMGASASHPKRPRPTSKDNKHIFRDEGSRAVRLAENCTQMPAAVRLKKSQNAHGYKLETQLLNVPLALIRRWQPHPHADDTPGILLTLCGATCVHRSSVWRTANKAVAGGATEAAMCDKQLASCSCGCLVIGARLSEIGCAIGDGVTAPWTSGE